MATKLHVMKLVQEMRGFAEITNRRPQPRTPGLFLLQMRSHLLHACPPKDKRTINIDMQSRPELPHLVKIRHLKAGPEPLASQPAR